MPRKLSSSLSLFGAVCLAGPAALGQNAAPITELPQPPMDDRPLPGAPPADALVHDAPRESPVAVPEREPEPRERRHRRHHQRRHRAEHRVLQLAAPVPAPRRDPQVALDAVVELGALMPLYHHVQFGRDGTEFDYVGEGGQDVLFPFARLSMELQLSRHRVIFLYQPLELETKVVAERAVTVDGLTFPRETPLDLNYGFPFYRLSYLYDVARAPALGASLQIRDATITFTSADGNARRSRRDVGPVPALKARAVYTAPTGWFFGGEVDGFYAPVKYLNGGDSDVVGAIIDANLRAGYELRPRLEGFVNLRWLGGGAEGSSDPEGFSDGYTQNWLHFLTVSLGVSAPVL